MLLANIYAAAGKWELSASSIQQQRKDDGLKKQLDCTWIEVNNEVHRFVVDDQLDHPEIAEICAKLKRLSGEMKNMGYVPDTKICAT